MTYYTISPNSRQRCLLRIEAARKATTPAHSYGYDGEGRHRVRVLCPNDGQPDMHGGYDDCGGAFRDVRAVQDIPEWFNRRDGHKGWYTDPDCCASRDGTGTCWGMVAYLGHGRWLAGYHLGGTDCGGYHLDAFYDSEIEAAFAADEIARIVAEREQEHQRRWQEARELEERIEEKRARLAECLALRNDKRPCFARLRDEARECIEAIREARETLANDYAGVL